MTRKRDLDKETEILEYLEGDSEKKIPSHTYDETMEKFGISRMQVARIKKRWESTHPSKSDKVTVTEHSNSNNNGNSNSNTLEESEGSNESDKSTPELSDKSENVLVHINDPIINEKGIQYGSQPKEISIEDAEHLIDDLQNTIQRLIAKQIDLILPSELETRLYKKFGIPLLLNRAQLKQWLIDHPDGITPDIAAYLTRCRRERTAFEIYYNLIKAGEFTDA